MQAEEPKTIDSHEILTANTLEPPPFAVTTLLSTLQKVGYQAYIVGGAVRDRLLQRETHDYDVATDAHPDVVLSLFDRTIPTGIQHGTVTVVIDKTPIEVTTYRVDKGYSDGRHPDHIDFTPSLREDLARRDFTINAIAWDPLHHIICDPFDGQGDLRRHIVKAVGRAQDRFTEDGLRALRAVRFATVLHFRLDDETRSAISSTLSTFRKIAKERIRVEIVKTLMSNYPSLGVEDLSSSGLLPEIMPDVCPVAPEQLAALQELAAAPLQEQDAFTARFATLLRRLDLTRAQHVMNDLRFSTDETRRVSKLLQAHIAREDDAQALHRMLADVGRPLWPAFCAYLSANDPIAAALLPLIEARHYLEYPLVPAELTLDGRAICQSFDLKPSRLIGTLQQHLLHAIWSGQLANTPSALLEELHRQRALGLF